MRSVPMPTRAELDRLEALNRRKQATINRLKDGLKRAVSIGELVTREWVDKLRDEVEARNRTITVLRDDNRVLQAEIERLKGAVARAVEREEMADLSARTAEKDLENEKRSHEGTRREAAREAADLRAQLAKHKTPRWWRFGL